MKTNATARAGAAGSTSTPVLPARATGQQPTTAANAVFGKDFSGIRVRSDSRPLVRRYTAYGSAAQAAGAANGWRHPAAVPVRVADDGEAVVEDKGWGQNTNKRAWTTPAKIAASNGRLSAQGSLVTLAQKPGGQPVSGTVPGSPTVHNLVEIEPVKSGGGPIELASDCGHAARQVMGSGGGRDVVALNRGSAGTREQYLTPRTYHGGSPTTPEEWSEELFKKEFGAGLTRQQAYARYAALTPAQRDAFDRKYGINSYARPRVGQGLTVSTEVDMPGFALHPGVSPADTWNFHFAANVLDSGADYVTLENAAGWAPTAWIFYMYGPRSRAQTFHEEHGGMLSHGTHYSTFVVQPEHTLDVRSKANARFFRLSDRTVRTLPANRPLRVVGRLADATGRQYYVVTDAAGERGTVWASDVQ